MLLDVRRKKGKPKCKLEKDENNLKQPEVLSDLACGKGEIWRNLFKGIIKLVEEQAAKMEAFSIGLLHIESSLFRITKTGLCRVGNDSFS